MKNNNGLLKFIFMTWVVLLQWVVAFEVHAAPDITIESVTASPGDTIDVLVSFTNNGSVIGAQFSVGVDNSVLTLAKGVEDANLSPHILGANVLASGKLKVLVFDASDVRTVNSGNWLTIPVTVAADATAGNYPLTIEGLVLDGGVIDVVTNGNIEVVVNVIVPDVVGQTEADATAALEALGLVVETSDASDATVPVGEVISQSVASGASVAAGSTIDLVISTGAAPVVVPDVVGQTEAAATTALEALGLVVETSNASDATVPVDDVISQSVASGTSVAAGSTIDLIISTGVAPIVVPNVIGETEAAATTALAGLNITSTKDSSTTVAAGNVISQSVAAGTSVAPDSDIDIVISLGPIIDVVGKTEAEARSVLTALGFLVTKKTAHHSTVPAGRVISQSPNADAAPSASIKAVTLIASAAVVTVIAPVAVAIPVAAALMTVAAPMVAEAANSVEIVVSLGAPAASGVTPTKNIPTLSVWGLLALSALMPGIASFMSRRKSRK